MLRLLCSMPNLVLLQEHHPGTTQELAAWGPMPASQYCDASDLDVSYHMGRKWLRVAGLVAQGRAYGYRGLCYTRC